MLDIDDTIVAVHSYARQGSGYGYSEVSGTQRAPRHGDYDPVRAGSRGPTTPEGIVWFTEGRGTAGRRRAEDPQPTPR